MNVPKQYLNVCCHNTTLSMLIEVYVDSVLSCYDGIDRGNNTHTHTHRLTALFRDYPGEPVPER